MSQEMPIDGLPPDARTALLGLIGSTFAELKKVDEHLITKNQFTAGIKTDLTKLIQEANTLGAPPRQQAPQLAPQPVLQPSPQLIPQPVVVNSVSSPRIETYTGDDPNQLQFDFYKKITPEDLLAKLTDINISLNTMVEKLNKVHKILADGNKDKQ